MERATTTNGWYPIGGSGVKVAMRRENILVSFSTLSHSTFTGFELSIQSDLLQPRKGPKETFIDQFLLDPSISGSGSGSSSSFNLETSID